MNSAYFLQSIREVHPFSSWIGVEHIYRSWQLYQMTRLICCSWWWDRDSARGRINILYMQIYPLIARCINVGIEQNYLTLSKDYEIYIYSRAMLYVCPTDNHGKLKLNWNFIFCSKGLLLLVEKSSLELLSKWSTVLIMYILIVIKKGPIYIYIWWLKSVIAQMQYAHHYST